MIVDKAKRLCDRLVKYFTFSIMDNAAFKIMSLQPLPSNLSTQSNQSDIQER
jgi:hypothetical protein